jgi:hypothetical protein
VSLLSGVPAETREAEFLKPDLEILLIRSIDLPPRRPTIHPQKSYVGLLTAVVLLGIAAYRTLVIGVHGEPSGLDFGNWLMLGHQALGDPLQRAAGVTYPPVVPLLSVGFTNVLGLVWGTALLSGLASVLPGAGVYAASRMLGAGSWPAGVAAALIAVNSSSGEAAAWGGVPQLIALGMGAVVIAQAQRYLADRRWDRAALLGVFLLALAATSHLVLAQVAVAMVVLVLLHVLMNPTEFSPRTWLGRDGWLAGSFLALALTVTSLGPLYWRLVHVAGSSALSQQGITAGPAAFSNFVKSLYVVYRDAPWLWKPLLIATAITPLLLVGRRFRSHPLWPVLASLVVSLVAEGLVSGQDRFVYMAPIAVGFAVALWGTLLRDGTLSTPLWKPGEGGVRRVLPLMLVLSLVMVASGTGLARFPSQRAFYGALQAPGTMAGLDWLRGHTNPDALFIVPAVNGSPFGWWVQGYGRRGALVGSDDQWLNFPEERARADEVAGLFDGPNPLAPSVMTAARNLGAQYLLLPWLWGELSEDELNTYMAQRPGSVVFNNSAMVIVRIPQ